MSNQNAVPVSMDAVVRREKEKAAALNCEKWNSNPKHKSIMTWRWGWRGIEFQITEKIPGTTTR